MIGDAPRLCMHGDKAYTRARAQIANSSLDSLLFEAILAAFKSPQSALQNAQKS